MNFFKCTTFTRSNLLNLILWGGFFLVGTGCSTGIIDSDEEDQTSDYNEPEREGESNTVKQKVEKCIEECYSILGLSAGANRAAIQKAYKKLACKHHSDKGGKDGDFQKVGNARDALVYYCDYLERAQQNHGSSNIDFEELGNNADIKQIMDYS